MKKILYSNLLFTFMLMMGNGDTYAQDSTLLQNKLIDFPDKLFNKVHEKSAVINDRLVRQSDKYLQRMARVEKRLRREIARIDSVSAEKIFGEASQQYDRLQQKMKNGSGKEIRMRSKYLPHLDSLQTAFRLLDKTNGSFEKFPGTENLLKEALGKMDLLQYNFNNAEEIREFIQQRRQLLQEQLGIFGFSRELRKFQEQVYYYQAQVDEYKRVFEIPSQIEAKALSILQKTSLYRDFFRKHSQLASLFRLPEPAVGNNPIAAFAGFQTRETVQQQLLQRFGSLPDLQQLAQQQSGGATQLSQLRNKVNSLGKGNSNVEMPGFKPNNQKTKSFKNRLEFGGNLQTVKSNYFFPSTSDIAVTVGYKLNDKSTIGIGSSYKMGWGKDIGHIAISHQGIGLRSFLDVRIKGDLWIAGGAEMNYRSQFRFYELLNKYTPWQKSALLGLSKKYRVSKKLKGNMQLMYDFLYKQQVPRTQAVIIRVGYVL